MSESGQANQKPSRPVHEWIVAGTLVVTSLAAVAALYFTRQSIQATNGQLQISEQGQITDRYNAATTNLGSGSIEIRLGGIYALQRLMQDSSRDQPTVVAVLCAFVRDQTGSLTKRQTLNRALPHGQPTDIQAALTVVGTRATNHDTRTTVVDFDHAQLAGARLGSLHLSHADFTSADLVDADLSRADLTGADLTDVDLADAELSAAHVTGADLTGAHLTGADLDHANLIRANLGGADLTRADLSRTDLTRADLLHAKVNHTDFTGATLTGALWPADAAVPEGWQRDHTGHLTRLGPPPLPSARPSPAPPN